LKRKQNGAGLRPAPAIRDADVESLAQFSEVLTFRL
jgi:hypothetical protein